MGLGDIIKSTLGGRKSIEGINVSQLANIDLPLSGDSESMFNDLISKGVFKNKADFMSFIVKAYMQNNIGSMMSGDKAPPESAIMDIVNKSGIGKGYMEGDIKNMMVPLLMQAFFAVYKYMSKRQAMKPA